MSSRSAWPGSNQLVDMQWTDIDIFTLLLDDGDISSDSSSDSDWSSFEDDDDDDITSPNTIYTGVMPEESPEPIVVPSHFRTAAQHLSDEEFFEEFRINRNLADSLAEQFRESRFYGCHSGDDKMLSAYDNLLVFLWFAGHKAILKTTCEQFEISISSLLRIIRRIAGFLSSISACVIKWPDEDQMKASAEYFRLKGIPFTIGAIGVDQIITDKPADEENFIPVQVICDHVKRIRHVYIGSRGSDGSTVFGSSKLNKELEQLCAHYVILGDHKFPCLRYLVTPYRGSVERKQKLFNQLLSQGRGTVEGCLKKLKLKFPQLEHVRLRLKSDINQFITACCVLHNLSLKDDFLQHSVGRTLQSVVRSESAMGNCSEMNDTADGLEYREDLLTAISIRRNWR